jgi:hypothetical protein
MKARRISFAGCIAIALGFVLAAPGIAAKDRTASTNKPYSLVLAPATVPGGSTTTITATYTNLTSQQQLGSSNLTAPDGFTVTGARVTSFSFSPAPAASATVDGNVVKLRNLSTPAGESVTVSLTVRTSCGGAAGQWTAVTKQANDFNGPPGNDLSLDTSKSSTTTTSTGGCKLVFSTQPSNVQVGNSIAPPVAVSVLSADDQPTDAAISITVGLATSPAGATLSGTKTLTSAHGVATFSNLSVSDAGDYTLLATSPNASSATSAKFTAFLALTPCINNVFCTATATTTGTVPGSNRSYTNTLKVDAPPNPDANVSNDGGALALSYRPASNVGCSSYSPVSPDQEVVLGPNRVKTVTSKIAKAIMDARHRSATSLQTCLIAPYPFDLGLASANGGTSPAVGDVDGDGNTDYAGLLPSCHPVTPAPPCQVTAFADAQGNGIVVYDLPADPRDPSGMH